MNKQSGVYKITNTCNGNFYIGSSIDLGMRFYSHKLTLRNGNHCNSYLQRAWNKYGENSFVFVTLLLCDKEKLAYYEQRCLDVLKPGYNISVCVEAFSRGLKQSDETREKHRISSAGRKHSEETKAKIGAQSKGRIPSADARAKMSASRTGEKNYMYGKTISDEVRERLRKANTGRHPSDETRAKMSAAGIGKHNCLGYKHTDEARANMSAAGKGRVFSEEHRRKIGEANRRRTLSEETRRKISEAKKGKPLPPRTEEHRMRISAGLQRHYGTAE